jgi:hypothetical protein
MNTPETIKNPLTPHQGTNRGTRPRARRSRAVENDAYTAFCTRTIRAAGRRIANGDIEGLPDLIALHDEVDAALAVAVTGLRSTYGYSWAEIASRLGITRQAAQQRWGTGGGQ